MSESFEPSDPVADPAAVAGSPRKSDRTASRAVDPEALERAKHGSFRELFPADELRLYGVGTVVFVLLALVVQDVVLNWIIGPLFITVWAWYAPVARDRWRARRGRP